MEARTLAMRSPQRRKRAAPILPPASIFCPVGRAMDAIGDRWTLVLVRHLLSGPKGFQELRVRSGIAPRVLSGRLRQLSAAGLIASSRNGTRPVYRVTERGRSLEPVISAIARWYLRHGLENLNVDPSSFSATSALSVLESLPHMLREDRARDVDLTFEIRLTGLGGGVWTVRIQDGACTVSTGFAEHADVRYTADARVWCAVALGIEDAREVYRRGLMTKDGSHEAMDRYFYQVSELRRGDTVPRDGSTGRTPKRKRRRKAE
jgi:DNA-binding HxlR family transcriptional regulator